MPVCLSWESSRTQGVHRRFDKIWQEYCHRNQSTRHHYQRSQCLGFRLLCYEVSAQARWEKFAAPEETYVELARYLLELGADPNWINPNAIDPLLYRRELDKGTDPIDAHRKAEIWYAPLHAAARNRNSKIVSLLLKYGAEPNIKDSEGYTPLERAMMKNVPTDVKDEQTSVVQVLIKGGCKVYKTDEALEKVAYNGNLWFVQLLLYWGVSQAAKDSALYKALAGYNEDVAMELLNAGARPKRIGDHRSGESTLHRAVRCGSVKIVTELLNLGADPSHKDEDGKTPIDVARYKLDIARLLKAKAE